MSRSTPTFEPPTHEEPIRTLVRPLNYFRLTYANSIVRVNGVLTSIRTPSVDVLAAAGTEGVDWFRGGRVYPVTNAQAIALEDVGLPVSDFPLRSWFAAVRNRANAPAKLLVIGDSISEGVLTNTPAYQYRWIDVAQRQIRARLNGPVSAGYMPAFYADSLMTDDTTRGGAAPTENAFTFGLGGKMLRMPGTTGNHATLTWPAQTCTKVRIHYGKVSFLGGNFKVWIDGVDVTSTGTLSTGGASGSFVNCSNASNLDGLYWESATLTSASHTVMVESITNGSGAIINAAEFFNGDLTSGIHIYDGGHSGAKASDFIASGMDPSWQSVAAFAPHVALVNLGTNDAGSVTPSQFKANIATLVSKIQTASPGCVVVLTKGWRPGTKSQSSWNQYMGVLDEVAASTPNCTVFDIAASWPVLTTDGNGSQGLMYETTNPVHPNTAGHQFYADLVTEFFCPTGAAL